MPGNTKGRVGSGNLGAAGGISGGEESGLELVEDFPRTDVGTGVSPTGGESSSKFWALSNPLWNTRLTGQVVGKAVKRKENGKVIREARTSG